MSELCELCDDGTEADETVDLNGEEVSLCYDHWEKVDRRMAIAVNQDGFRERIADTMWDLKQNGVPAEAMERDN